MYLCMLSFIIECGMQPRNVGWSGEMDILYLSHSYFLAF